MENNQNIRTDLALEAQELWRESAGEITSIQGVEAAQETINGFIVTTVNILDKNGEEVLGKPAGKYVTIELDGLIRREENSFSNAVELVAKQIRSLMNMDTLDAVFVAGLGNNAITPDAIGPETINSIMITRHLKERMPQEFAPFKQVAAVQTGVLGTTGIESADLITAVISRLHPDCIIAVDALASRSVGRLCRTLQISNTGIIPGSGVGNSRMALNEETLGVPVVAIGVPTVVDADTLLSDMAGKAGWRNMQEDQTIQKMIVTPRDIDKNVRDIAKLIGYSINMAIHKDLTLEDIDMFVS